MTQYSVKNGFLKCKNNTLIRLYLQQTRKSTEKKEKSVRLRKKLQNSVLHKDVLGVSLTKA